MRALAIVLLLASTTDAAIVMFGEVRGSQYPTINIGQQSKFVVPDYNYLTDIPAYTEMRLLVELGTYHKTKSFMEYTGFGFRDHWMNLNLDNALDVQTVSPYNWSMYIGSEANSRWVAGKTTQIFENVSPTLPEPSSTVVWACLIIGGLLRRKR